MFSAGYRVVVSNVLYFNREVVKITYQEGSHGLLKIGFPCSRITNTDAVSTL